MATEKRAWIASVQRMPLLPTPSRWWKYGLLRFARNDELHCRVRQINPTGKSPKSLSIPSRKNIPLAPSGKSVI